MLSRVRRAALLITGLLLTGVGLAGLILPILPSTIFFILAVACFARSSPRLEAWLLSHPRFGASLRQWRDHGVIGVNAKRGAVLTIALSFVVVLATNALPTIGDLCLALILIAVSAFIVTRPSVIPR